MQWEKVTGVRDKSLLWLHDPDGYCPLPSIPDYLKLDEALHYAPIARRISKNRFFDIHKYLHFADNSKLEPPTSPRYDKLGKVRQVLG